MKKVILLLLAIVVSTAIYAQNQRDIIYLNNGSIIHGSVIEMIPNESVKIKNSYGDILVYKMDEVKKIEKEEVKEESHRPVVKGPEKGYRGFFELGHSLGIWYDGAKYWSFSTTHGYQFNPYIFAGAGIGYHESGDLQNGIVFADGRFTLNMRHSPFIDLKAGYAVLGDGDLFLSPTIGYRFGINSKLGVFVGLSVDIVYYTHNFSNYSYYSKTTTKYSFRKQDGEMYLKFGFEW